MQYTRNYPRRHHTRDADRIGVPILDKIAKECLDELKSGEDLDPTHIVVDRDELYDYISEKVYEYVSDEDDRFAIMQHYQKAKNANLALAMELAIEDVMSFLDRNFVGDISF